MQKPKPEQLDTDYKKTAKVGGAIIAAGMLGITLWASIAPLDEGVPASAVVSVETKRKHISHLGGGVVDKILVKEGQMVEAGQPLLTLDEAQAKAALNTLQKKWYVSAATLARLQAERSSASTINFPMELVEADSKDAKEAMRNQSDLFQSRRQSIMSELRILADNARGLQAQAQSLKSLADTRQTQSSIIDEQIDTYQTLQGEGFLSKNYLLDAKKQSAEAKSKQNEAIANLAASQTKALEAQSRTAQRVSEYRSEVETQLAETQKEFASLSEQLQAQLDTVSKLSIKAPVSGVVVDLSATTIGGSIKPAERIMDIVPKGDKLVMEAQIPPQYIDRVRPGLPADIRFDAYATRAKTSLIEGKLEVVSADALTDPRTGATYYSAIVSASAQEIEKLGDIKPMPGMPTTVIIKTGERTLMTYLFAPLLRRFSTALVN